MPSSDQRPVFYFDLGSPYAYLSAERVNRSLPEPPIWRPILLGAVHKMTGRKSWAVTDDREAGMREVERRAEESDLGMPIRWPEAWPGNMLEAMRTATYASRIGRGEAFALAAFRQAYAAGKDLADIDNILMAAAACEISPNAVLKAIETDSIKQALKDATDQALETGVIGVPTFQIGSRLIWGDDKLDTALASDVGSR